MLTSGCLNSNQEEALKPPQKIVMRGNHAYIPLNMKGTSYRNAELILNALELFELKNNVRITSRQIEQQFESNGSANIIHGVWIDFEPVTNKTVATR